MNTLTVLVLGSLGTGRAVAQAIHAATAYARKYPEDVDRWALGRCVVLTASVDDMEAFCARAAYEGIAIADFHEPDLDGIRTAVAVGECPTRYTRRFRPLQ